LFLKLCCWSFFNRFWCWFWSRFWCRFWSRLRGRLGSRFRLWFYNNGFRLGNWLRFWIWNDYNWLRLRYWFGSWFRNDNNWLRLRFGNYYDLRFRFSKWINKIAWDRGSVRLTLSSTSQSSIFNFEGPLRRAASRLNTVKEAFTFFTCEFLSCSDRVLPSGGI
jgi:hypothetical protein